MKLVDLNGISPIRDVKPGQITNQCMPVVKQI